MQKHLVSAQTSPSLQQVPLHRDTCCVDRPSSGVIFLALTAQLWLFEQVRPTPAAFSPVGLCVGLQRVGASAFTFECIDPVVEEQRSTGARPTGCPQARVLLTLRSKFSLLPAHSLHGPHPACSRQVSEPTLETFRQLTLVNYEPL